MTTAKFELATFQLQGYKVTTNVTSSTKYLICFKKLTFPYILNFLITF